MPTMKNGDVQINLRLPGDLHARLTAAATEDVRSLNGEIVHLLTIALDQRPTRNTPPGSVSPSGTT